MHLLLAVMSAWTAAAGAPRVATVSDITLSDKPLDGGAPFLLVKGSSVRKAPDKGAALEPGEAVVTSAACVVTLSLSDGSRVQVGPGSRMSIDNLTTTAKRVDGKLRLDYGLARAVVSKVTAPFEKNMEVTTPNAVVSVKGTELVLEAPAHASGAPDSTTLSTLSGAASIATTSVPKDPVVVPAGFSSNAVGAAKPAAPLKVTREELAARLEAAYPSLGRKLIGKGEEGGGAIEIASAAAPAATSVNFNQTQSQSLQQQTAAGARLPSAPVDFGVRKEAAAASGAAPRVLSCVELEAPVETIESTGRVKAPTTLEPDGQTKSLEAVLEINQSFRVDDVEKIVFDPDVDLPTRARLLVEYRCFGSWQRQHDFYRRVVRENKCALLRHRAAGLLESDLCAAETVAVLKAESTATVLPGTRKLIGELLGKQSSCSRRDGKSKPEYGLRDVADACESGVGRLDSTTPGTNTEKSGGAASVSF